MKLSTLGLFLLTSMVLMTNANADNWLADCHKSYGLSCESCHGKGVASEPETNVCTNCHNVKDLVKKTEPKVKTDQNPHFSPHYQDQLECNNCHKAHAAPEDFCSSCHDFKFNVK